MKRVNLKCPYCGSQALLRPASVIYGKRAAEPLSGLRFLCGSA